MGIQKAQNHWCKSRARKQISGKKINVKHVIGDIMIRETNLNQPFTSVAQYYAIEVVYLKIDDQ